LAVLWSPEAEEDMLEIWSYVAHEASPAFADRQLREIYERCATLESWPNAGRPRDELRTGIRSFPMASYVIFYEIAEKNIWIVRVLHGNRDIETIFARS
jgi:toxin ParE1/3/4